MTYKCINSTIAVTPNKQQKKKKKADEQTLFLPPNDVILLFLFPLNNMNMTLQAQ